MKLTNIRTVGRFRSTTTGQVAHIKAGENARGGVVYFYGKAPRMICEDYDLRDTKWWSRVDLPSVPCCGGNDDILDFCHTMDCRKHPGEPVAVPEQPMPATPQAPTLKATRWECDHCDNVEHGVEPPATCHGCTSYADRVNLDAPEPKYPRAWTPSTAPSASGRLPAHTCAWSTFRRCL